jgi:mitogen-activated protein kinase 15
MGQDFARLESVDLAVLRRYEIVQKIGRGAYGVVWRVVDRHTGRALALKKAYDAFDNATDAQRTYREITLLRQLRGHPNVVELVAVHRAANGVDVYLAFEYLEADLNRVVRAGLLRDVHHRFVFWQLLCALRFLHSAGVVHRDLKPANILVNADASVKLCDFGLARALDAGAPPDDLTEYIATRWYRAPECLLGAARYGAPVDMWAAGCILAEVVTGRPLFPGASTMDELERVVAVTGAPPQPDVDAMPHEARAMLAALQYSAPRATLQERMASAHPDAVDLVRRLIAWNPAQRPSAEECLAHPYVAQFHSPQKEIVALATVQMALKDGARHSVREYRGQIYREAAVPVETRRLKRRLLQTIR